MTHNGSLVSFAPQSALAQDDASPVEYIRNRSNCHHQRIFCKLYAECRSHFAGIDRHA
jgi:hypothetical protein